jgi:hypothetical protein
MSPKGRGQGQGGLGRGGSGQGAGRGIGTGRGPGRMGGQALGPVGYCLCPACGTRVEHQRGIPCTKMTCPKCGSPLTRE